MSATSEMPTGRDRGDRSASHPVNISSGERWSSSVAGAAIGAVAAWGLYRRRFWGIPLAMIGAGLARRGITGYCDIYGAFGIDHSEASKSPSRRAARPLTGEGLASGTAPDRGVEASMFSQRSAVRPTSCGTNRPERGPLFDWRLA